MQIRKFALKNFRNYFELDELNLLDIALIKYTNGD